MPDQDPQAAGKIIRFETKDSGSFAIADLTAAHKKAASKAQRGVMLMNRKEVLVQDEIRTETPASLWWFMHTAARIRIGKDGREAVLEQAGKEFHATILSPANAKFQVMDAQPLPDSPHPEKQTKNENVRKLAIHLEAVRDVRISVLLRPGSDSTGAAPAVMALEDWR
jgi:hypothetical protein